MQLVSCQFSSNQLSTATVRKYTRHVMHIRYTLRCAREKSGPQNKLLKFNKNLSDLSEILHVE